MNKLLIVKHHDNYDDTDEFFCREIVDNSQISEYFQSIWGEISERCSETNENFDIIVIDFQNNDNIITTYKDLIQAGFEQILKRK